MLSSTYRASHTTRSLYSTSASRYEYCDIHFPLMHIYTLNSSQGTIDSFSETPTEQETPKSAYLSTAKDILGVASSFTQMLLKKAPDAVDGNPVRVAFGIAKIILQIKDVCYCSSDRCLTDFCISGRERQPRHGRTTDFIYSSPAPRSARSTG